VAELRPRIQVLAGTNGCGKSSIGGAMLRHFKGTDYFNPDEIARLIRASRPDLPQSEANALAWHQGKVLLERAISERRSLAFETTLGGSTIARLLREALLAGLEVCVWYAGLRDVELHLARVRERVARGGHDIPERDIRRRYDAGRLNLIALVPHLTELRVYDNSEENDPALGFQPRPKLILHMTRGRIAGGCALAETPEWAKPIVAAAMKCQPGLH
jgi:predicted ABC-type ATPase